jgi:hypothetical protein
LIERRTLTLNWRPTGTPARRRDDFAELRCDPPLVTRATDALAKPVQLRDDISARLENWARWAKGGEGPVAAACMTGAICETMRKAVEGTLPSQCTDARGIDTNDAAFIGRAMVRLPLEQRKLLGLYYVDGSRKGYIAALMRFKTETFDARLLRAQLDLDEVIIRLSRNSNTQ